MKQRTVLVALLSLVVFGAAALAQEHPEHPKEQQAEHPEAAAKLTLDELEDAITGYVARDSKLKGGYFLVYDPVEKKPLVLQLEKVHKDRLSALGDGVYFACTDMKAGDGTIYDLDFFMKRSGDAIEATEVAIHKKAGKPRYGWKEQGSVWKKVKI